MNPENYRLFGFHNPVRYRPTFLVPVFSCPGGKNDLYMQISDWNDRIRDFVEFSPLFSVEPVHVTLDLFLPSNVFHAFLPSKDDPIFGFRDDLAPQLDGILTKEIIKSDPLLALEIAEFCANKKRVKECIAEAFAALKSVSTESGEYWRDKTLLTGRVRQVIARRIDVLGDSSLNEDATFIKVSNGVAELHFSKDRAGSVISDSVFEEIEIELSDYLEALGLGKDVKRIEVIKRSQKENDLPATKQQAEILPDLIAERDFRKLDLSTREMEQPSFGKIEWILVGIGKRSRGALGDAAVQNDVLVIDISGDGNKEDYRKIRNVINENRSRLGRKICAVIVFDAEPEAYRQAQELSTAFGRRIRVHAAALSARSDEMKINRIDLQKIEGVTLVPYGHIPTADAGSAPRPGRIVAALLNGLSVYGEPQSSAYKAVSLFQEDYNYYRAAAAPDGLSVFSYGSTRMGVRAIVEPFKNALANAINSWIPIQSAADIQVTIASVGRPTSELIGDMERIVGETFLDSPPRLNFHWRKRKFGGSPVSSSVYLVGRHCRRGRSLTEALSQSAKAMLRLGGFKLKEGGEPLDWFVLETDKSRFRVSILSEDNAAVPRADFVIVASSRQQRNHYLEKRGGRTLPLTIEDLFYLSGRKNLAFSAEHLARWSLNNLEMKRIFAPLIEEKLREALRQKGGFEPVKRQAKNLRAIGIINGVSIANLRVKRQTGRGLSLSGAANITVVRGDVKKGKREEFYFPSDFEFSAGLDSYEVAAFNISSDILNK